MVLRGSNLVGRTLKGTKFRERYGLTALAINRHGVALLSKLSMVSLRFGDVLLVQGKREQVEHLATEGNLLLLEDVSEARGRAAKRRWALLAFGVFLFVSIFHPFGGALERDLRHDRLPPHRPHRRDDQLRHSHGEE
jgi:di/tricarboxylate transporter